MRWLLCKLLGHRWRTLAVNWRKHTNLVHICSRAGFKEQCDYCGEIWDDTWSPVFFGDEIMEIPSTRRMPLPRAHALPPRES